jgi:hypothetical protein
VRSERQHVCAAVCVAQVKEWERGGIVWNSGSNEA